MQANQPKFLNPQDIGLILSYQCQNQCSHCVYNCSPAWKDWITPETIDAAFEQIKKLEPPVQVHVTGGEPFIRYELLRYAVNKGTQKGLQVYLETNAGWHLNEKKTTGMFTDLKENGLKAVLISLSPFHAEQIPLAQTQTVYRIAKSVFPDERVWLYLATWLDILKDFPVDEPVSLQQLENAYGKPALKQMLWEGYGLISGGRAGYELEEWAPHLPASTFEMETCVAELLYAPHSHFDLYGNFIPGFCGGISLGYWKDMESLQAVYYNGKAELLLQILMQEGPYGLYLFANREYGYVDLPGGYSGKCHLCVDVRRHLQSVDEFSCLKPEQFYEFFD